VASHAPPFDVVLVSDDGPDLPARAAHALAGLPSGRVALQLRRPDLGAGALLALARALRDVTRAHGALLLVNDRVDVALLSEADGVQLPERSVGPEAARKLLGPHAWIGVSHHAPDQPVALGASFALVSPVLALPGKAPPIGVNGVARAVHAAGVPVYALGGVTAAHIPALRAVGARGVAAIRAVWTAPDPRAALAAMLARFDEPLPDVARAGVRG
jgi:thiamine-phosphate pyrophosphorylase